MATDITKRLLGDTLRHLCRTQKLKNLTVRDITNACAINRGTFYYHFYDRQELINWIFHHDIILPSRKLISSPFENWKKISPFILNKLYEDRPFYQQAFSLEGQNCLKDYAREEILENIQMCAMRLVVDTYHVDTNDDQIEKLLFAIRYLATASYSMMFDWITSGMEQPPEELARELDLLSQVLLDKAIEFELLRNA